MPQTVRPVHIDLAAILAEPTPQIDLRLHAYEISTTNFVKAVTNYTNRAVLEITKHRNSQETDKKKLIEKTHAVELETNQCKLREIELLAVLSKEQDEKRESEQSITALKRQLASIRENCATIDTEIEQYRAAVANLQRGKSPRMYRELWTLNFHASKSFPELTACQRRLQCVIEGVEKDLLLVRFSHIDEADVDREFSFVLDVSSRSYRVITTTPVIPKLPILLSELNESRDIYRFIKMIRLAFVSLVR
ncbi:chromosome segregation protein Spc25-domain-containing protein [Hygrophoropsis aurantiaca]|uniref:Chromosome segregation protein Spc25-domain-containing protein n=1 Tax=Hygrophoropsis aurantiaca TaxID=72124 RepID=A0ACB8AG14_9AGAM|nr:chromosome segregation protein Spc25-domain-containing protein [Hygrophoropsis aurantiaca]